MTKLPQLGCMNARFEVLWIFKGKTTRGFSQTPLDGALASITLGAKVGDTVIQDGFFGKRKYTVTQSGGGDRTKDGRWLRQTHEYNNRTKRWEKY